MSVTGIPEDSARNGARAGRRVTPVRTRLAVLLLAAGVQLGCEKSLSFQEIDRTNKAVAADVKSETGREALVGLLRDGSRLKITVTLVSASASDAEQARPKVEAIVKRHWPKVTEVVVEAQ